MHYRLFFNKNIISFKKEKQIYEKNQKKPRILNKDTFTYFPFCTNNYFRQYKRP